MTFGVNREHHEYLESLKFIPLEAMKPTNRFKPDHRKFTLGLFLPSISRYTE